MYIILHKKLKTQNIFKNTFYFGVSNKKSYEIKE